MSVEEIVELVLRFAIDGKTTTTTGTVINVESDSVCVHGDIVNAREVLDGLHAALIVKASTYEVTSMPDRKLSARYANMPVRRCFPHPLPSCTARIGICSYRVTDESLADFLAATWEVSTEADRIGYRLKGPTFHFKPGEQPFGARADPSNAVDLGYPMGSIQISGGLEAILLLNDAITIGEYMTSTLPSEVILTVLRKYCLEVRCAFARVILKRRCTHERPARRTLTKYASRYGCSMSPVSWVSSWGR